MKTRKFKPVTIRTRSVVLFADDFAKLRQSFAQDGSLLLDFTVRQYSPRRATVTDIRLSGVSLAQ